MKIISCLNLKGGSGKTTTAVNLAAAIGESRRVRLLDLDPQRSATRWASQSREEPAGEDFCLRRDVHHVEASRPAPAVRAELDRAERDRVAVVILDCPPELEDRSLVAALVSDLALVPVTPSPLDLWAAERAVATAREARAERGGALPRIALVPSRTIASTVLARELPATLAALGEPVAPGISQRVALVECAVVGQTIDTYAPGSPAHGEFTNLRNYVMETLGDG